MGRKQITCASKLQCSITSIYLTVLRLSLENCLALFNLVGIVKIYTLVKIIQCCPESKYAFFFSFQRNFIVMYMCLGYRGNNLRRRARSYGPSGLAYLVVVNRSANIILDISIYIESICLRYAGCDTLQLTCLPCEHCQGY